MAVYFLPNQKSKIVIHKRGGGLGTPHQKNNKKIFKGG
jgi:hypothetical protein